MLNFVCIQRQRLNTARNELNRNPTDLNRTTFVRERTFYNKVKRSARLRYLQKRAKNYKIFLKPIHKRSGGR